MSEPSNPPGSTPPPKPGSGGPFKVQIQMSDEIAKGSYTNMAAVNHTQTEFILDFIYIQPQAPKGNVLARLLMHPMQAKRLAAALQQHIGMYEKRFGVIGMQPPTIREEDLMH